MIVHLLARKEGRRAAAEAEGCLAETSESVVYDCPQHLLIRIGLADDHQSLTGGHQPFCPYRRIDCGRDLAQADGGAHRTGEPVLDPAPVPAPYPRHFGIPG